MYRINIKEKAISKGYWQMIIHEISNKCINHQVYLCNVKHKPWVDLSLEKYYSKIKNTYVNFTLANFSNRHFDVCNLILQKLTCKQIGNELNLTHRTVEAYIVTIRTRFLLKTKKDLLCRLRNSNFREIYKKYLKSKDSEQLNDG